MEQGERFRATLVVLLIVAAAVIGGSFISCWLHARAFVSSLMTDTDIVQSAIEQYLAAGGR